MRGLEDIKIARIPETITFECELSSAGIDVEWSKNDRPIRKGGKYDIIVDGAIHKLIIKDADGPDAGIYAAHFKNRSTAASLIIQGERLNKQAPVYILNTILSLSTLILQPHQK